MRTLIRPTGFVDSPFDCDGKVARLAGGLNWFASVELLKVDGNRRVSTELLSVEEFEARVDDEFLSQWRQLTSPRAPLQLGDRTVRLDQPQVMGIVNVTPDSFSDGGRFLNPAAALKHARRLIAEGADIIDIGGVKAGPGAEVDVAEEIRRTVATIAAVRREFPGVVISIDTWRAAVATEAVAAGADLLNDTWAGADPELAVVAAETGAGLVCSHAGGLSPRTRPHRAAFDDVLADVLGTVTALADRAVGLGVRPDGIVIDPAHDFGKNTFHSLEVTRRIERARSGGVRKLG